MVVQTLRGWRRRLFITVVTPLIALTLAMAIVTVRPSAQLRVRSSSDSRLPFSGCRSSEGQPAAALSCSIVHADAPVSADISDDDRHPPSLDGLGCRLKRLRRAHYWHS